MLRFILGETPPEDAMKRTDTAALLALVVAVPAVSALFAGHARDTAPCFIAGTIGYRIADAAPAAITVRIDNDAMQPDLRLEMTDDAASADFVLVDDTASVNACAGASAIRSIRLDPHAAHPDLTVSLSHAPATRKIYVRSAGFSREAAAALFAAMWQSEGRLAGEPHDVLARN